MSHLHNGSCFDLPVKEAVGASAVVEEALILELGTPLGGLLSCGDVLELANEPRHQIRTRKRIGVGSPVPLTILHRHAVLLAHSFSDVRERHSADLLFTFDLLPQHDHHFLHLSAVLLVPCRAHESLATAGRSAV